MTALPKPPKREKAAPRPLKRTRIKPMSSKTRASLPTRRAVRLAVIERDDLRCRMPWCRTYVGHDGHVHEIVYRSRGGSPLDVDNCILLCPICHAAEHAHRIEIRGTATDLIITSHA